MHYASNRKYKYCRELSSYFNGDDWFQVFVSDFDRLCGSLSLRLGFRQNSADDMTLTCHLTTKLIF